MESVRILVLADTHDKVPEALDTLAAGVDEIWHLGDVCAPEVLARFEALGPPVTVVRGNCDTENEWPLEKDLEHFGWRFRLIHIPPDLPPPGVHVLLHGHTHVPCDERRGEVRYLNPGCVTRPNRGAPPSVAYLEVGADRTLQWTLKRLR